MKLFYVANVRLPTEKAHGLAIMKMCEAFSSRGLEVELIVPKRKNSIKEDPFEYYGVEKNFKITKLWCLDLVSLGWFGFWIQTLTFAERLAWYTMFRNGIFYTREEFLAFYLKIFGKKVFWEAHTAKSILWVSFLRIVNGVVAISDGLRDYYVTLGISSDKTMVAHSGIDLKGFDIKKTKEELRKELSLPLDKKIVAYVGKNKTMGRDKGVEELRLVLETLKEENPEIYPLFVTESKPNVVPLYMKSADVLVMNYPNTEHYAKFMSPLKLFEYVASGVPIVAPDLPSIREILSDKELYFFKPGDDQDLTLKVKQALSDKDSRMLNIRKLSEYTWDKRAQNILRFIR